MWSMGTRRPAASWSKTADAATNSRSAPLLASNRAPGACHSRHSSLYASPASHSPAGRYGHSASRETSGPPNCPSTCGSSLEVGMRTSTMVGWATISAPISSATARAWSYGSASEQNNTCSRTDIDHSARSLPGHRLPLSGENHHTHVRGDLPSLLTPEAQRTTDASYRTGSRQTGIGPIQCDDSVPWILAESTAQIDLNSTGKVGILSVRRRIGS